jgi:3-methyladenine DNA glycosylase AlkD
MSTVLSEILVLHEDAANSEEAVGMAAYMKGIAPFYGIKAPQRKALQKEIMKHYAALPEHEWIALLLDLYAQPPRELQYLAMDWLYFRRKQFTPQSISLIEQMITTKSWWDTVDFLAGRCLGDWAIKFPVEAKPVIQRFISSPNFWLNRSAILHQLNCGQETDAALLAATILPHLGSKEFFIRKAIGWALRQYGRTAPDWVREFVDAHPLSSLSSREALKHLG